MFLQDMQMDFLNSEDNNFHLDMISLRLHPKDSESLPYKVNMTNFDLKVHTSHLGTQVVLSFLPNNMYHLGMDRSLSEMGPVGDRFVYMYILYQ